MRIIDADALLEGREDHEMISTHLIWNAPTIDAEPVRHGRWVPVGDQFINYDTGYRKKCSWCGSIWTWPFITKFCPNCGAKMRTEEEDE